MGYYDFDDTSNQWHFDNTTSTVTTNILIAASASETSADKIVAVKLPAGDIRNSLNLSANPGNYKKEVLLHGDILKYCGKPGVANLTGYKLDGQGGGDEPTSLIPLSATLPAQVRRLTPTRWLIYAYSIRRVPARLPTDRAAYG